LNFQIKIVSSDNNSLRLKIINFGLFLTGQKNDTIERTFELFPEKDNPITFTIALTKQSNLNTYSLILKDLTLSDNSCKYLASLDGTFEILASQRSSKIAIGKSTSCLKSESENFRHGFT
jgi:hypothetical protein